MRRHIAWLTILTLLLWAPVVSAQNISPPLTGIVGPAGTIWYGAASQIISNTTAATWLFSTALPGTYFATGAASNTQSGNLGPNNASIPMHLIMEGLLDTISGPGTINIGVNFGVGTTTLPLSPACTAGSGNNSCWFATEALTNAYTPAGSLVAQPVRIDVWLNPIATGTATQATPNIVNTVILTSRIEISAGIAASGGVTNVGFLNTILRAGSIAQVNIASSHLLNVVWQFGTLGNYLRIYKVILKQVD